MAITQTLKDKASEFLDKVNVKMDQTDLELFRLSVTKDPVRSRLNVVLTSEIGVDFEGDTIENVLGTLMGVFLPSGDKPGK